MINFNKYTLQELRAAREILSCLIDEIIDNSGVEAVLPFIYYRYVSTAEANAINQLACEAPADPTADPLPAGPDMFGWVGDSLDDLCAAGEVLGSNE